MNAACCRFCGRTLNTLFCDLGITPLANAFLKAEQLRMPEPCYPLRVYICDECLLVQLEEFEAPERIFADYVYFSSYSATWLEHASHYATAAIDRFGLTQASRVVEIASNDGYLLQYFQQHGIPVMGIEPAANVAAVAQQRGIATIPRFFGVALAEELVAQAWQADLLVANNVMAHVPDINDFVAGLALVLKPTGTLTVEVPHLLPLIEHCQFDTIYHEHFSYFSLRTIEQILAQHNLRVFDVDRLATHGGSLRIYAQRSTASVCESAAVIALRGEEAAAGLHRTDIYADFMARAQRTKDALTALLRAARRDGKTVAAYGAAAKGNTLLNYCGIGADLIEFVVDSNPHKQGKFLPGSHLPVRHPDAIRELRPEYLLILPWNIAAEIVRQTAYIREWGGKFVVPIPEVAVWP